MLAALAQATGRVAPRFARLRHHLPAPGRAGQVGGDDRPHQRRPSAARRRRRLAGQRARAVRHRARSAPRAHRPLRRGLEVLRGLLRDAGHHRRRRPLPAARRHRRAQAGAGPAADPHRRQGRSHARHRGPRTPTSGTCGRARRRSPSARRSSTPAARRSAATRPRSPARARPCGSSATTRRKADAVGRPRRRRARRSAAPSSASSRPSAAWADVGVDEVIVPDFTLGTGAQRLERIDLIIEEIAPAFRAQYPRSPGAAACHPRSWAGVPASPAAARARRAALRVGRVPCRRHRRPRPGGRRHGRGHA